MTAARVLWRPALLTIALLTAATADAAGEPSASDTFRVGYVGRLFTEVSRDDVEVALRLWAREVAGQLRAQLDPGIRFVASRDELIAQLRLGSLDLVALTTPQYLAIRDSVAIEPVFVTVSGGDSEQVYDLLVRRDRNVGALEDLAGGTLLIHAGRGDESVASLWLDALLLRHGLGPPETFFGTIREATRAAQAALGVFFGQADAALLSRSAFTAMSELNPQLQQDLVALASSPPLLPSLACFPANMPADRRRLVLDGALGLHQRSRGRQILVLFGTERVVRFEPRQLQSVVDLIEERRRLQRTPPGEE